MIARMAAARALAMSQHPAFSDAGPPSSLAAVIASGDAVELPKLAQYARASIIGRRIMSSADNAEAVLSMLAMAEDQVLAHWDVLGEPAGPEDHAYATVTRVLWLAEILLVDGVGDALEAILPAAIADPLWAELLDRDTLHR